MTFFGEVFVPQRERTTIAFQESVRKSVRGEFILNRKLEKQTLKETRMAWSTFSRPNSTDARIP
eukprot:scaffold580_cov72-Cylindrotheca_fusiformis.AAC.1